MIPALARISPGTFRKPRASGDDPGNSAGVPYTAGVNPARAGMIRVRTGSRTQACCKPRASGDDPYAKILKRLVNA